MPEIVVYAVGNRPAEQKKALCKDITDAMVKNYKVPADAVVALLGRPTGVRYLARSLLTRPRPDAADSGLDVGGHDVSDQHARPPVTGGLPGPG